MRRTTAMLSALLVAFAVASAAQVAKPRNVILVGWDGAHRDHVRALLKDGKLPNLAKLVAQGTIVDVDVTSGKTDTKAGWTQILTGYRPQVTGVYGNANFRDVPAGLSVFERLKSKFGKDAFACVAVIGKKAHCGEIDPPFKVPYDSAKPIAAQGPALTPGGLQPGALKGNVGKVVEENGSKFVVFGGSPYHTMHKACDDWTFGLVQDAKVGYTAIQMLDKHGSKPFFFFVHFAEVDHSGHQKGEPSQEYNHAIVSNDVQLGRIMEKLAALGHRDDTLIYVTADHGFDVGGKGHSYAPYVFLATNDKAVMRGGTRADVAPTVLDRFGVDLATLQPPLDGESLTRAATRPVEKAPAMNPNPVRAGQIGPPMRKGLSEAADLVRDPESAFEVIAAGGSSFTPQQFAAYFRDKAPGGVLATKPAVRRRLFNRLDADASGSITLAELKAITKLTGAPPGP